MGSPGRPTSGPAASMLLPAELWMQIMESAIDYDDTVVTCSRQMRERHDMLRGFALVCRGWAPIAQVLLFREVALGCTKQKTSYENYTSRDNLRSFLATMEKLRTSGSRLPQTVRTLHMGIGRVGNADKGARFDYGGALDVGRAIVSCPNLQQLDLCVGYTDDMTSDLLALEQSTVHQLTVMKSVTHLLYSVDVIVTRNMLDAASVFNILRQLLASWPDIEIMCLELPPFHGNELDDCPPMRTLRELRCSGVPPTTLLDMLSEPGHQFSRLVIVDPALVPTVADAGVTSFPEEFIVPSSTQELTIVGDLAAYKLDFLRAQQIKTVTWDWQSPNSPDPDAISRIADAHLPASIETFALSAYYVASTHAEGQLEGALTYLASELTSLRRIALGAADDALDLFGSTLR